MRAFILGIALTLSGLPSDYAATTAKLSAESPQLAGNASQTLARVKEISDRLHLAWFGPTTFVPTFKTIDHEYGNQENVVGDKVHLGSKTDDFSFRCADGRLVDFGNVAVSDAMIAPKGVLFHGPKKASWTTEKAIETASAFLHVFADPLVVRLGPPQAKYISQGENYRSYWRVYWPRVDAEGHPFFGDFISIEIPEGSCPLGAAVFLSTPFKEEDGKMLSAEEASEKAHAAIATNTFLGSAEYFATDDRIVSNKRISADLAVVLPAQNIKVMGGPSTGSARLAWILWFHPEHLRKQVGDGYNDSFALWVDAYNGQIIGRDGYL